MNIAIMNFSDLAASQVLSAEYHVNKANGRLPFVKRGDVMVPVDITRGLPKGAVYLTQEQADSASAIMSRIVEDKRLLMAITPQFDGLYVG
jgi:hypothetical protein